MAPARVLTAHAEEVKGLVVVVVVVVVAVVVVVVIRT